MGGVSIGNLYGLLELRDMSQTVLSTFNRNVATSATSVTGLESHVKSASTALGALPGPAHKADDAIEHLGRTAGETRSTLSILGSTAGGVFAGMISAQAVLGAVGAAFRFAKDAAFGMNETLETSTLQFATLMGDSDKAREHVKGLFEFAKHTPFETGPIIQASKMLQTFGGNALNTKATLTLLGDASAATGAPIEELGTWIGRLYSSLQAGRPFGEAAQRLQELAILSPAARNQLEAMQKSGKSANEIFSTFEKTLGSFTGAMELQAGTWSGVTSTFTDSVNMLIADALKPLFESARDGLRMLNDVMSSDAFDQASKHVADSIKAAFGGDSQATIRTLGMALLTTADVALTAADLIGRGWSGLKLIFAQAMIPLTTGAAAILDINAKIAESNAKLASLSPLGDVGGQYRKVATEARDAATFTSGVAQSFRDQAKEAYQGMKGNDAWTRTLDAAHGTINVLRDGLLKATTATKTGTEAVTAHGQAAAGAAGGVHSLTKAEEAHAAAIKKIADTLSGASAIDAARDALEAVALNQRAGLTIAMMTRDQQNALNDVIKAGIKVREAEGRIVPAQLRKIYDETFHLRGEMEKLAHIRINPVPSLSTSLQGGTLANQIPLIPRSSLISAIGLPTSIPGLERLIIQTKEEAKATEDAAHRASAAAHQVSFGLAEWGQELRGIGNAIGGVVGQTISGVGTIVSAWGEAQRAALAYRKAIQSGDKAGQAAAIAGGASSVVGLFVMGVNFLNSLDAAARKEAEVKKQAIEAAGGLHAFELAAYMAGRTMDQTWNGKPIWRIDQITAAIQAQQAAMERNNLTWRDFDQTTRQLNVDQLARVFITDFKSLTGRGADPTAVIKGMSVGLNQLVIDAVKTGTKIPIALKPILESLIRMGGLTDAAARAMLGLADDTMPSLADIKEAADRYGLKLDQLGSKVKQLSINEQAKQIVKDFDLLTRAGVPLAVLMEDIPSGFREQVQGLISDSLTLGLTLPENLKPIAQVMIDNGWLTDQFGKKLTDIGQLHFERPLVAAIDDLILKLQEWIDKMSIVGTAAEDMGRRVRGSLESTGTAIPRDVPAPGLPPSIPPPPDVPDQGTGGGETAGDYAVPRVAAGGFVSMGRVLPFAAGGAIEAQHFDVGGMGRLVKFVPKGIDVVPAMLAEGEGVVNRGGMRRIGEDGLSAINHGAWPLQATGTDGRDGGVHFHRGAFEGVIVDSDERIVQLTDRITKVLSKGGMRRTRARQALRIK